MANDTAPVRHHYVGKLVFCTGNYCPAAKLCARAVRIPPQDVGVDWQVMLVVPWSGDDCKYFWPEARPGCTEVVIPEEIVGTVQAGDKVQSIAPIQRGLFEDGR